MMPTSQLQGKQVLIPRGKHHAKAFTNMVEKLGGIPVEIPLIAFRPVAASEELHAILNEIHTYDWLILTSNVTVETLFSFIEMPAALPKIAVIGEKTQNAAESLGARVDFIPGQYVAEGFVEEFAPHIEKGMKVLIPKGNLAREYIAAALTKQGAIVDEVVIYETYLPRDSRDKLVQMIKDGSLDILTFTSPSTIDHFMEIVEENKLHSQLEKCLVACIGPVSKRKAEEWGMTVHVSPEKYTVEEMLNSIVQYLKSNLKPGGNR